ncbi:hypothetical protein GCM10010464_15950 [Pseudonocardia yunnanensis]|uniref:Uncharacterized protein n=1 Tax=Pseudonocardia yunnanensis TaxID=58107 RepID=A0ABW4EW48_9PSEU
MLDVGPANPNGEDHDLAVFVDRLAAAGSDPATASAKEQIRRTIEAGASPPGLRRLAEALAASVGELPPPQRHPAEDSRSIVAAMRDNTLVILEEFDPAAVAGAVAALLADGRRVVVTATDAIELGAVRTAMPADAASRALDGLPPLTPAEMRELRRLLATSTPERRARAAQELPDDGLLPAPHEVAALCAQADWNNSVSNRASMVPALLSNLDPERRNAVTSVARCVSRSLGALPPRTEQTWLRGLLSHLIYGQNRAPFDRMLEDTAQAVAVLDRARYLPPVSFSATPPPGALDVLRRYREYLESGGRARSYFRNSVQREVRAVLAPARVGPRAPETADDVQRVIEHLELGERRHRIHLGCMELGLPTPRNESELSELAEGLVKVAAAARSVGALRHDVLFLAPDSPLSVPDVESAEEIAGAILEYADHGGAIMAERRLDSIAGELAARGGPDQPPEYEHAVVALRKRDANAYAAAFDALAGARRDVHDENLQATLLQRLGAGAPELAEAWTALAQDDPATLGVASFLPVEALLSAVPPADSADVVLVLDAAELGVERLLLTAVAPRMVAVVAPDEQPSDTPSLLSVLRRASALVIRRESNGGGGRVVPLNGGNRKTAPASWAAT